MTITINKEFDWKGSIVPMLYFILMTFLSAKHTLFFEWDGLMQYLSSTEIASGKGYLGFSSRFWPPLYTSLTALLTFITHDGFASAKLISMISSFALLWVIYFFMYEVTGRKTVGLLTQICVALNPTFIAYSFSAQNIMLDTLFFVTSICFFFRALQSLSFKTLFITGTLVGLACLSRYTSYALIPAFTFILFLYLPYGAAFRSIGIMLLAFVLISASWWIFSFISNDGIYDNWNYLNVGYGMIRQEKINVAKWWWKNQADYNSLWEIFTKHPGGYIQNVGKNISHLFYTIIIHSLLGFIVLLVLICLQHVFARHHDFFKVSKKFLIVSCVCFIIYAALISQAFIVSRILLHWYVIIIIAIFITAHTLQRANFRLSKQKYLIFAGLFLALELCASVLYVINYLRAGNKGDLVENQQIIPLLKGESEHLKGKIIMAIHPAWAYHLNCGYLMMPRYYESSNANDLVTYRRLEKKILNFVPRFPSNLDVENRKPDYLIFNRSSSNYIPQFSYLLDPDSDSIPKNFERIYLSSEAVVFKIH